MEKSRKQLKLVSAVLLILLAISFSRTMVEVFRTDFNVKEIPAEFTTVLQVGLAFLYALLFLPQVYVGIKGIKVANNPDNSKAHIVWAVIFIVFSVLSVGSAASAVANAANKISAILGVVSALLNLAWYVLYVVYAKRVAEGR